MVKKQKTRKVTKGKAKKKQPRNRLKPTIVDIPQQALLPQLPSESESIGKAETVRFNKKTVLLFIIIVSVIILMLVFYIIAQQGSKGDTAGQVIGVIKTANSCVDTDVKDGSNDNPLIAGTAKIEGVDTENEEYSDTCTGNYLTEYYCNGKNIESKVYKCNNGCTNNACTK